MADFFETINWVEAAEELPADDSFKLIVSDDFEEPVWLGYYEDGAWWDCDGEEIETVTRWADMPTGQSS